MTVQKKTAPAVPAIRGGEIFMPLASSSLKERASTE
jgi:hypothetical protein